MEMFADVFLSVASVKYFQCDGLHLGVIGFFLSR